MIVQVIAALLFTSALALSIAVIGLMVVAYKELILAALTMQTVERVAPEDRGIWQRQPRRVVRTTMVLRRANPLSIAAAA